MCQVTNHMWNGSEMFTGRSGLRMWWYWHRLLWKSRGFPKACIYLTSGRFVFKFDHLMLPWSSRGRLMRFGTIRYSKRTRLTSVATINISNLCLREGDSCAPNFSCSASKRVNDAISVMFIVPGIRILNDFLALFRRRFSWARSHSRCIPTGIRELSQVVFVPSSRFQLSHLT